MTIDKKFIDQFIKVSSKAALASSYLVGKKDKIAADQAAVDSMRTELNKISMNGKVVIGEEGIVSGKIICENSDVAGTIKGNLDVSGILSLKSSARIEGEVVAGKLAVCLLYTSDAADE